MMQKITAVVTGNVVQGTEDLVIRQAGNATVLKFTIASNNFAPAGRERTTSFIRVRVFNRDAEILARYLTKGKPLSVIGRMELRPYQSNKYRDEAGQGAPMISAELIMQPNGFEFINGGRRRDDAAFTQPAQAATPPVAEQPAAEQPAATTTTRRSRSRRSAPVATETAGVQELAQPGGPF